MDAELQLNGTTAKPVSMLCTKMENPRSLYSKFNEMPSMRMALAKTQGHSDQNGKETMEKDEINQLRSQVLCSNRPTNPWFETQKPFSCPAASSSSPSSVSETEKVAPHKPNSNGTVRNANPSLPFGRPASNKHNQLKAEHIPIDEVAAAKRLAEDLQILRELESESAQRLFRINQSSVGSVNGHSNSHFPDVNTNGADRFNPSEPFPLSPSSSNSSSSNNSSNDSTCATTRPTSRPRRNDFPVSAAERIGLTRMGATNRSGRAEVKCAKCDRRIAGAVLNALDRAYHPACFRCARCLKCLDGVPFTIDNKGIAYCMDDYERIFVPACAKCTKPIAAINKFGQIVRVILSGGIEYHMECYCCEACGKQLSNEPDSRCYPLDESLLCRKCHMHWKRMGGVDQPITDL